MEKVIFFVEREGMLWEFLVLINYYIIYSSVTVLLLPCQAQV